MSDKSSIEWLDGGATWNPVRGCTPCSRECQRCYARTFAERFRGVKGHPYERGFDLRLVPEALDLPRSWRKPRRVFVNSMSDLFHEGVPFDFIEDVFATMAETPRHAYIVLTKRAARMAEFVAWLAGEWGPFQLPNVTLGVSVGTRERLPEIEILRQTPAARRMVSFEPLLEDLGDVDLRGIDFAAIGGESGPKARPCDVAWIRSLVAQCRTANVAPYVKQLGTAWARAAPGRGHADRKGADMSEWPEDLRIRHFPAPFPPGYWDLCRHDILRRDCAECSAPPSGAPPSTVPAQDFGALLDAFGDARSAMATRPIGDADAGFASRALRMPPAPPSSPSTSG